MYMNPVFVYLGILLYFVAFYGAYRQKYKDISLGERKAKIHFSTLSSALDLTMHGMVAYDKECMILLMEIMS